MLSGHETSTDFCNMKVEGRVVTNEPMWRKEVKSLKYCRERSTLQNPHEAIRGPKYSVRLGIIQSKTRTKNWIRIFGSLFPSLYNNEKNPPLQFL